MLLSWLPVSAQLKYSIKGKIADTSGLPLSKATVVIRLQEDSIILLTGGDGSFIADNLKDSSFRIKVSMKGYANYEHSFSPAIQTTQFQLPTIILQPFYQELGPVIIGHLRNLRINGDTTQFFAGAYRVQEGAAVTEMIKQLPGMNLIADSGLFVMGKKVKKLLLDGKPFYGNDILNALSNLPYDLISRIEIVDDFGDNSKFTGQRAIAPEKVINIILKKEKNRGLFGSLESGIGNSGHYIGNLNANLFQEKQKLAVSSIAKNDNDYGPEYVRWIGFSYTDEWAKIGSISTNSHIRWDDSRRSSSAIIDNFYASGKTHQQSSTNMQTNQLTQEGSYEIRRASNNDEPMRLTGFIQKDFTEQSEHSNSSNLQTDSNFTKKSITQVGNQSITTTLRSGSDLFYGKRLNSSGHRLALDGSFNYSSISQRNDFLNQTQITTSGDSSYQKLHYQVFNKTNIQEGYGNFHYYAPIGKIALLETRYGIHFNNQQNNRDWRIPDLMADNWKKIDSLSNNFSYNWIENSIYSGLNTHSNKTDLRIGLNITPGHLSVLSIYGNTSSRIHYTNVLPEATFAYSPSSVQKIGFNYGSELILPTLPQVTPVTDLSNPQYPIIGNPFLKPTVKQTALLQYERNKLQSSSYKAMSLSLSYSFTQNQIVANLIHPHDTSSVIQKTYFQNINGDNEIKINYRFETPILPHFQISSWGSAAYGKTNTLADSLSAKYQTVTISQYLTLQYILPALLVFKWTTGYNYVNSHYPFGNAASFTNTQIDSRIDEELYLFHHWKLTSSLLLRWSGSNNSNLELTPPYLVSIIERSFLPNNQLSCKISVTNLLNSNSGNGQQVTATSISQYNNNLTGRRYMFSIKWAFEKFRKKIENPTK